ncbi:pilus assembly protein FlpE [Intrasporangium sp. YIM S08009]|uniref:pilus assembly protein FlpE n=1 Tax=Intrasporangium zincisolvens TaxID=3080018 RepID=UPI002B05EFF3|nr:pilus assembly protein FlpE [Intrasporangium sp. YIM S08009]
MGNVIAVLSASGGVGASCLAAALAVRAAAAGRSAVAVDLDRGAGRLDVVLGVEQEPGWRWPDLADVRGVVDGSGLADRLPTTAGVAVLSGVPAWTAGQDPLDFLDTIPDIVTGLADAHSVTVLDLPRSAGIVETVAPLVDAVVVVVGTEVVQLAAATLVVPGVRHVVDAARREADDWSGPPVPPIEPWVVLRGARVEPELEDLVTDELDVAVVAAVGDDRRVVTEIADGLPPGVRGRGPLVRAADELLLRLVSASEAA